MLLARFCISSLRWKTVLLAQTLVIVSGVFRSSFESSSYFDTYDGYALLDHVFHSQLTNSFMTCAQSCLTNRKCKSLNFQAVVQNETVGFAADKLCELNDFAATLDRDFITLEKRKGSVYARLMNGLELQKFVFTNLGGSGPKGPTSVLEYKGTNLDGKVQLDKGIQVWNVTSSGKYSIWALGASGGNGTCAGKSGCSGWKKGGKGASIKGTFRLERGMRLKILVGQKGRTHTGFPDLPGGGGGGSFVVLAEGLQPLLVAGGGGGGGIGMATYKDGDPGQAGPNGTREGGVDGKGGQILKINPGNTFLASSGAGFHGDGMVSAIGTAAKAFINGGDGASDLADNGGFGGGGFGMAHPGGGGGYSGGGVIGNSSAGVAGGGGSYNLGTSQDNEAGINEGDGRVVIIHIN